MHDAVTAMMVECDYCAVYSNKKCYAFPPLEIKKIAISQNAKFNAVK